MYGASLVNGGRGKEGWKWVKSGGEMVQPPTIDRSSAKQKQDRRENSGGERDG